MYCENLRQVLDNVRTKVPVSSVGSGIHSYNGVSFPAHGSGYGQHELLNSGGRSALIERSDGRCGRIKAIDPFGVITNKVARYAGNLILDVISANAIKTPRDRPSIKRKVITTKYRQNPFGVLLKEHAENSILANGAISEYYAKCGFPSPCKPVDIIPLDGDGAGVYCRRRDESVEPACSVLLELPSPECDLRHWEFERSLSAALMESDHDETMGMMDELLDLYLDITKWHAFSTRAMYENMLVPHRDSILAQNYVMFTFPDGKVGYCRVDHSETEHLPKAGISELKDALCGKVTNSWDRTMDVKQLFSAIPEVLIIARWLGENQIERDPRFESYFDFAYAANVSEDCTDLWDEIYKYREKTEKAFNKAFRNGDAEPIDGGRFARLPLLFGTDYNRVMKKHIRMK